MNAIKKLIIENQSGLPDEDVLEAVLQVVKFGKVSETAAGKQYSFAMTLTKFTAMGNPYFLIVECAPLRKGSQSYKFFCYTNEYRKEQLDDQSKETENATSG